MVPRELIDPASTRQSTTKLLIDAVRPAVVMLVAMSVITGIIYPLVVTGIAQAAFPKQARGSLVARGSDIAGSRLLGQEFDAPQYFWGRLSATGPIPYNAASSSGSNYGPLNPALVDAAKARIGALRDAERAVGLEASTEAVPQDLVTSSGSGLDPHISPAAAEFQATRVAKARGMSESDIRRLIREHTEGRQLGILGEPRVNVLMLNLALDDLGSRTQQ